MYYKWENMEDDIVVDVDVDDDDDVKRDSFLFAAYLTVLTQHYKRII